MTTNALTAMICAHNPRSDYIDATLRSLLAQQPLPQNRPWELIIVDNASDVPLEGRLDLSWHLNARVVRESRLGLTHARLRGFKEAKSEILVYVDDDNVLASDYLRNTLAAFDNDAKLGAVGGKVLPQYEVEPPPWLGGIGISLACRDLGDASMIMAWTDPSAPDRTYPECAPIGAGIGIRRQAFATYVEAAADDPIRAALGRRGVDLSSGEDNDMIMCILEEGWTIAYLPQLRLDHLISARRLSAEYLEHYAYSSTKTWVQVLDVHGICPWPAISEWTVKLRQARAYVRTRAWKAAENRVRWYGACGMIEGQAAIGANR